jgi:hypothetical protein
MEPNQQSPAAVPPIVRHIFYALIGIVAILLLTIFLIIKQNNNSQKDFKAAFQALENRFDTVSNKFGQQTASVPVAEFTTDKALVMAVEKLNERGDRIESKVNKNTEQLVLFSKRLSATIEGKSTVIKYDTAHNVGEQPSIMPTYGIADSTKWYTIKGWVSKDRFVLTPMFVDSTEMKLDRVGGGLFKSSVLTASAFQKSPYAKATQFKVLTVKKEPAPIWGYIKALSILGGGIYLGTKL